MTHKGRPVRQCDGWWEYTDGGSLMQHDDLRCWVVGKGDYAEAIAVLLEDGWKASTSWRVVTSRLRLALTAA